MNVAEPGCIAVAPPFPTLPGGRRDGERISRWGRKLAQRLPVLLLPCIVPPIAWADETSGPRDFRFRGASLSITRNFMLTEFGVARRITEPQGAGPVSHATFEIGAMHNLGARTALGGTVFLSTDDHFNEAWFLGMKPRFRFWPAGPLHVDVSAGLLLATLGAAELDFDTPALLGHVGIGVADWVSLVVQYEDARYTMSYDGFSSETHREQNVYVGLTSGSYLGAIVGPLAMLAIHVVRNSGLD